MVFLIPMLGILFWIALFLIALVLWCTIWVVGGLVVGLVDVAQRVTGRKRRPKVGPKTAAGSTRNAPPVQPGQNAVRVPAPAHIQAEVQAASDIWPKWNPSHRRYVDGDKSAWQEEFDALTKEIT